jgi:hypothetical protein
MRERASGILGKAASVLSTTAGYNVGHAEAGDRPALGWTVVLRRQPPRSAAGWTPQEFELICCYCGDHPDLDYRDVAPELQRIRGPYPLPAGVVAYEQHLGRCHRQP